MMDTFLRQRLRAVFQREQIRSVGWELAVAWLAGAAAGGLALFFVRTWGWVSSVTVPLLATGVAALAAWLAIRRFLRPPDYRRLATQVEKADPHLQGLILTAVQQTTDAEGRPQSFLQQELLSEAIEKSAAKDWRRLVPGWQVALAHAAQVAALVVLVMVLFAVDRAQPQDGTMGRQSASTGLSVTPGDAEIERGETFVVMARFGDVVPGNVQLIVEQSGQPEKTIPLVKSMSDPVFGGTLANVSDNFRYRIAFAGQTSREYAVKVFEFPRLERSDAELTFPAYTRQEPKRIEDTRRLSAVEGTRLGLTLQLNKPVAEAKLVARDKAKTVLALTPSKDKAVAMLPEMTLAQSQTYDLHLTDAEGRANKLPIPFVIDVQPNRRPELRLASPRGDVRPSLLEEIAFQGTVWDDFGSPAYGLAYSEAGGETTFVELGKDAGARERRTFNHLLRLEELQVKPDTLLSWYLWADDIGPDGQVRRTTSDLYFGEIRPFDEIFREETGMQAESEDSEMGQSGNAQRLTELQKQIMTATWKLQRDPTSKTYGDDVKVVRDSQVQALGQAREASEQSQRPADAALWTGVIQSMESAASQLNDATEAPKNLSVALSSEQSAYQGLLKLQQHETNVSRSRSRRGGQGGRGNQQQMDQLDLAQEENRYETQRQARSMQDPQRREQSQTINRLQELAQRQEAVNERLKELQTALQEARTEEKREEIRRELKRLQEEQRDMLADVDELRQRMDRPENQSRMAEERRQLEQTRQDVQRAADAAAEGSVSQALAAGTRAQRQLQDMRDSMRKENSSQFSEELRELRGEARELARQQQAIGEKIKELADSRKRSLTDQSDREKLGEDLATQRDRMENLINRATELSEQSENIEPLVSRQLYDSLRKVSQDDANISKQMQQDLLAEGMMTRSLYERLRNTQQREGGQAFDLTSELLREGYLPQAITAENKARAGIEELRKGVEKAVSNVLGDDAEALRHAQSQLDELTEQLVREAALAQQGNPSDRSDQSGQNTAPTDDTRRLAQTEQGAEPRPGEGKAPSDQPGQGAEASGDPSNPGQAPGAGAGSPGERQMADNGRGRPGSPQRGGTRLGGFDLNRLMDGPGIADPRSEIASDYSGPIMGDQFGPWVDGLRDVEGVLDNAELRNAVAAARERAPRMRQEYRHDRKKPDWAVVRAEILNPLVEVRTRIVEELARRNSGDPLVPVDRDPVPARFAESVRKYYEELGKSP